MSKQLSGQRPPAKQAQRRERRRGDAAPGSGTTCGQTKRRSIIIIGIIYMYHYCWCSRW